MVDGRTVHVDDPARQATTRIAGSRILRLERLVVARRSDRRSVFGVRVGKSPPCQPADSTMRQRCAPARAFRSVALVEAHESSCSLRPGRVCETAPPSRVASNDLVPSDSLVRRQPGPPRRPDLGILCSAVLRTMCGRSNIFRRAPGVDGHDCPSASAFRRMQIYTSAHLRCSGPGERALAAAHVPGRSAPHRPGCSRTLRRVLQHRRPVDGRAVVGYLDCVLLRVDG